MPVSKHRKNHKQKVEKYKAEIKEGRRIWNEFQLQRQIALMGAKPSSK